MKRIVYLMAVMMVILFAISVTVYADVQITDINSGWYWPTSSRTITSEFGRARPETNYPNKVHQAVDISASEGSTVHAARVGDVVETFNSCKGSHNSGQCSCSGGVYYGNYVVIYHGIWNGNRIYSMYMHLKSVSVNSGTSVQNYQEIGKVGNTGPSNGAHLHFQISKGSKNPSHNSMTQAENNFINTNPDKVMFTNSIFSHNRIGTSSYPNSKYGDIIYIMDGVNVTPSTPTITSVSTVSTSSLKVKWNAISGATSYRIDRRRSGDESYSTIVSSTTSTSYTDTGLLAGEKYYYRVYALNGSVISDRSESIGAYTQCDIPEITSAVGDSTSSITIKWNYVNGASYYRIDRRKQTEDAYQTIVANHTGSRTYTDTGLVAGAKYYYRVYAVNDSSTSAKPDGYGGYTQCEIPTITSVVANSPSSITIKWNGVSGAASYRIDRRKQADDAYTTIVTGYTSKSYTDTGLEAGTKYYYRVYAVTEGSVSAKPDGEGTFTKYIYTIKYNANGGSGAPSSQSKIQDITLTLSSTKPTRTGYTFKNWNTKVDGSGKAYSASAFYAANSAATLYAQWTINKYTVTFKNYDGTILETKSVNHGSAVTYSESTPTRKADAQYTYTFSGWDKALTNITANTVITANFTSTVNQYTVTFNSMGGTEKIEPIIVSYGSACGELPFPEKGDFTFKGWYTKELDGEEVTKDTIVTSNMTLYAYWETVIPYTESTVTKSGAKHIIDTKVYNITAPYNIMIVGYKDNRFVTMKRVPSNEQNSPYTLEGDIDEIKVMVWKVLSTLKPLCDAEEIPSSKWIIK